MNDTQLAKLASGVEDYLTTLKKTIDALNRKEILCFLSALLKARDEERTIFIMGNGGSAATASHFVCDFNKGLSVPGQKRFKFICLNDNVPSMMAYGNDSSYDDIFVEQLQNFLRPGDLVIGISGSGNSMNVVKAVEYANDHGAETLCLLGYNGGKLKHISQKCIHVDIDNMQIVEDVHMILDHMGMSVLKNV